MTKTLATALTFENTKRVLYVSTMTQETLTQKDLGSLALLMWNNGAESAYRFYRDYICVRGLEREMAVSWAVEAMAFPGTAWESLFNLMCGEE